MLRIHAEYPSLKKFQCNRATVSDRRHHWRQDGAAERMHHCSEFGIHKSTHVGMEYLGTFRRSVRA